MKSREKKILIVCGTRPNFMKVSPLIKCLNNSKKLNYYIVHTGQHYDSNMSDVFFSDLNIPIPITINTDFYSDISMISNIMKEFEKEVIKYSPDFIVVVGDVNSTLACSLVSNKLNIKLAHIESGLRCFDSVSYPEETNRILTDVISDYLFVSEESGVKNLLKSGIDKDKIFLVGNIMIDTLLDNMKHINNVCFDFDIEKDYVLFTLHRQHNVDNKERLIKIVNNIKKISFKKNIIFPLHPRTRKKLIEFNLYDKINSLDNLKIINPVGYFQCINLLKNSIGLITDSGGLQSEATFMKKYCFSLRNSTGSISTILSGSNILVKDNEIDLLYDIFYHNINIKKDMNIPYLWDGKTSERIVDVLEKSI